MKHRLAGLAGNFLEHYDQALFGFLAPILAPLFFPRSDPIEALIYTCALMPLGMLSRPLGALVFGRLGDRIGRRKALSLTLMGMAIVTGSMGFLPTYFEIGLAAPILWGVMRLLQNFFAAGEVTGGAIFLLEGAATEKRPLWSSLFDAVGILGILFASGAAALVSGSHFSWRWLFWVGAAAGAAGLAIRFFGRETAPSQKSEPLLPLLWRCRKEIGRIALVAGFSYANYYLLTTFMNGFLPLVSSISRQEALEMNTLLLAFDFLLLPLFGWISAKAGKEKTMIAAVLLAIPAVPLLMGLTEGASLFTAASIRMSLTCIGVALAAPYHAWALETAPVQHRYLISAVGAAIGSQAIGAPVPAMALWLYQKTGLAEAAALPVIAAAFGAAFSLAAPLLFKKRLRGKNA